MPAHVISSSAEKLSKNQMNLPHDQPKNSTVIMTSDNLIRPLETKTCSQDISNITGKHLVYSYENGWLCEIYVKNATTLDYRIHSGIVANRWVKDQEINVVQLPGKDLFKVSWAEPTGTAVSLCINLEARQHHGVVFFPEWISTNAAKTARFQNDHLDEMRRLRDAGPIYPIYVVDEFAEMVQAEDVGMDDNQLISVSPSGFASTLKHLCEVNNLAHKLAHFGEKWGSRDTRALVGKHFVFAYQSGWQHELYVRSESSIDYKIRSSPETAWHISKAQKAHVLRLTGPNRYIISWSDLAGISVSLTLDLDVQQFHGVHFFPQWILTGPKNLTISTLKSSKHSNALSLPQQNGHSHGHSDVDQVTSYRDAGPTYPLQLVSEFSVIFSVDECGVEDDSRIMN
uniref:Phenolic acid decarboxylase n=1 Tax=Conocephalum japonicum TaxID=134427 RepID=A0A1U9X475_CONJP|nr:phenolic acid decarboxylase [Conocephalum japonicum]